MASALPEVPIWAAGLAIAVSQPGAEQTVVVEEGSPTECRRRTSANHLAPNEFADWGRDSSRLKVAVDVADALVPRLLTRLVASATMTARTKGWRRDRPPASMARW